MNRYISYSKLSKKEQKRINTAKRKSWSNFGCISPVSRVVVDKKKQDNKNACRLRYKHTEDN